MKTLDDFAVLDSAPEAAFDRLTRLAAGALGAQIAFISLLDQDRAWFKSTFGFDAHEAPRDAAFCVDAVTASDFVFVPDASADPRFAKNPIVSGPPFVRSFACAPLIDRGGQALGALCVAYLERTTLSPDQLNQLRLLRDVVMDALVRRRNTVRGERARKETLEWLAVGERVAGLGHWRIHIRDGEVFWSDEMFRLYGLEPGEIVPTLKTVIDFIHPDDRERTLASLHQAIEQKEAEDIEVRFVRLDGEERVARIKGMFRLDRDGDVSDMFGVLQDITELRSLEAATRLNEERMSVAMKVARAGLVDWRMTEPEESYWSDEMYAILGFEPGEVTPSVELDDELIHPDDLERVKAAVAAHDESCAPFVTEYRLRHKSLGYRWFLTTAQMFWDESGAPVRMISAFVDVHERRQAQEAAEAANRAKSQYLAAMSHEIRTPMNGVMGLAGALMGTSLDSRQRRLVELINDSGETLLNVVNKVLDLSKIEAGEFKLARKPFDIAELVAGVCARHETTASDKGLEFTWSVEDETCGGYLGDPGRIRQVLENLVVNARRFTEEGAVSVRVARGRPHASGACDLRFEVADTGVGIEADALERLFAPFVQVDPSDERTQGGTGLGLAISRRLCELMDGALEAASTPGEGSTFRFCVRAREHVSDASDAGDAAHLEVRRTGDDAREALVGTEERPLRVLAGEDNSTNRVVMETLLEPVDADVTFAENGREVVEAWRRQDFDVILMDIQMPDLDGAAATREIRRLERELGRPHTPIIAVTANALTHQVDDYLAAGMDAHVAKPIQARTFYEIVCAVLEADSPPAGAAASG